MNASSRGFSEHFGAIPCADFALLSLGFFLALHSFQASLWDVNREAEFYASTAGHGSETRQIGYIVLALYGVFAWIRTRWFRLKAANTLAIPVYALLFWICASAAWSQSFSISVARLFGFLTLCLAATGSAKRLSKPQIVLWLGLSTWLYVLIGVCTELALGTFHPLAPDYRFAGTLHPNEQGVNCALLLLAALWLVKYRPTCRLFQIMLMSAALFLLLTKSRTAAASVVFGLIIYYGCLAFRNAKRTLFFYALILLASMPLVLESYGITPFGPLLQMGRDQDTSDNGTLTGRVPLWQALTKLAEKRPIEGYGYGAFWTPDRIDYVSSEQGWGISAAHSAYLDAVLSVGLVGLSLYLIVMLKAISHSVKLYRLTGDKSNAFFGAVLTVCLINGIAESEPWIVSSLLLFAVLQAVVGLAFRVEVNSATRTSPNYAALVDSKSY